MGLKSEGRLQLLQAQRWILRGFGNLVQQNMRTVLVYNIR